MRDSWFYRCGGIEAGPVPFDTIIELAQAGQVSPQDELRRGDQKFWQPASDIVGLFDAAPNASEGAVFDDILDVAAVDDGSHRSGERVGTLLEDQLGYDPHRPLASPPKEPRFFCRVQGKEVGPFNVAELQQRADEGLFAPYDRIRKEDGKAWVPAQELSEIRFPASASTALKTRSISAVAETIAKQKPAAAPPPRKKETVDDLIDEVLSQPEPAAKVKPATPAKTEPAVIPPTSKSPVVDTPPAAPVMPPASVASRPATPPMAAPKPPTPVKKSKTKSSRQFEFPKISLPAKLNLPLVGGVSGGVILVALLFYFLRPSTPPVRGRATVDSQPIPVGLVSFAPNPGTKGPALSVSILNGSFAAAPSERLGSGPYKVVVVIGNPLGTAPPEVAAVPAFAELNGASFETSIDTTSGEEDLFVFQFAAANAKLRQPSGGGVQNSN